MFDVAAVVLKYRNMPCFPAPGVVLDPWKTDVNVAPDEKVSYRHMCPAAADPAPGQLAPLVPVM
jgi:hypothetical protein